MQNEPELSPSTNSTPDNDWLRGLGLLLLFHLLQIPLAVLTVGVSLIVIGVTQLLYVVPLVIRYRRAGRPGVVKGLLIGAALTLLLTGTCTALFFYNPPDFR